MSKASEQTPTAESEGRCTCGVYATVFDEVPDPGCPMHGARGIQAWSTCQDCGRLFRNVNGHSCPPPPPGRPVERTRGHEEDERE